MTSEFSNISRIAVISDTHGSLPSNLIHKLKRADLIIHAGDLDNPEIFCFLSTLAPFLAVLGNMDKSKLSGKLSVTELISIDGILFYILHDLAQLDIDPESIGVRVVISGHTHLPRVEEKGKVIYVNPGSATQPRGGFRPSFARIILQDHGIEVQIEEL